MGEQGSKRIFGMSAASNVRLITSCMARAMTARLRLIRLSEPGAEPGTAQRAGVERPGSHLEHHSRFW